jgi:hypothetical protein
VRILTSKHGVMYIVECQYMGIKPEASYSSNLMAAMRDAIANVLFALLAAEEYKGAIPTI